MSNDSRKGVVGPSTVYSEATLVFGSFCEGRAQQITTSGVIAMEKVLPGLYNVTWFILVPFLNILSCATDVKSL